jgi:mycothiol synthase
MSRQRIIERVDPIRIGMRKRERIPEPIPEVPGLSFRPFRGEEDYPAMAAVIAGSKEADRIERTETVEDVTRQYRHLFHCDPYRDMLFAEVDGQVVGYSRVWWQEELRGIRRYEHFASLLPVWRNTGIRKAMLRRNERRLRQIAAGHRHEIRAGTVPQGSRQLFQAWASEFETHWASLLMEEGYQPVRYGFSMVRPHLEEIPDVPLPDGLEIRPVRPAHHWIIWAAAREAFQDHWGETEWQDEWFRGWQESRTFNPELWQVAWDGDQVAGMVQNFIDAEENREYARHRGYTEGICVRRPWRRRGLARALIARSFRVLKAQGMAEAALGVDAENPNGALQLYKSMGFQVVKRHTIFRKPLV